MIKLPLNYQKNLTDIKFIDLFAGIGGLRIPFEKLGGECVFSCEIDPFCRQTYQANFNETPFEDIRLLDIKSLPKFNLLLAGFPCQPFSISGHKKGLSDERGNLFFEILRILEYHQPQAFLLENVKGLTHHNNQETLNIIISSLENIGYKVSYQVLNARDFGLPQNRERIFIVGSKSLFNFPNPSKKATRLGDMLEKKVDKKYTLTSHLWNYLQERKKTQKKKGNGFGCSLFTLNSPYTSTLSARYYKDGSEILIKENKANILPRRLTPRECARLQGFPDNFQIVVSDNQAYRQFGNSVALPVIEALAKEVIQQCFYSKQIPLHSFTKSILKNDLQQ
jgi:DNA (cytosine-5)-methyltransferase 1